MPVIPQIRRLTASRLFIVSQYIRPVVCSQVLTHSGIIYTLYRNTSLMFSTFQHFYCPISNITPISLLFLIQSRSYYVFLYEKLRYFSIKTCHCMRSRSLKFDIETIIFKIIWEIIFIIRYAIKKMPNVENYSAISHTSIRMTWYSWAYSSKYSLS